MSLLGSLSQNKYVGKLVSGFVSNKVNREVETIAEHFNHFLESRIANTAEEEKEVFKIRHSVYCEELKFEETNPDKMETDRYDKYSIFGLIKHRPSDLFTGCVRVVAPQQENELLPIEEYCSLSYKDSDIKPTDFKRSEISEISRLAVLSRFRRRKTDTHEGAATGAINTATYSTEELRCFPFISVGLYLTAASITIENGSDHVFVMMEPRLARSMALIGIKFKQLGEPVEYHGLRAPYYINGNIFIENLSPGFKSLHRAICESIKPQLNPMKKRRQEALDNLNFR
ncbi:MAG: GNAT family N-acetyltransferase [Proteobacteria bacterium]|nr:MAG: GNAT family N-acetyltransferase [Pseudomonadota bacterium]